MSEKAIKYVLHIGGRGSLGEISWKTENHDCFPAFQLGHYVALKAFDYQYEHDDVAIVTDVLWDFLGDKDHPEIHQFVKIREATSGEQSERRSRNKARGA